MEVQKQKWEATGQDTTRETQRQAETEDTKTTEGEKERKRVR